MRQSNGDITLVEGLNELNVQMVPILGLVLHFSSPKAGAALWDTWALDLETKQTVTAEPSGIKELDVPKRLDLTSKDFLLWVQEFPGFGVPGPYNFGPYVVSIPEWGEYTWNSRAGTIDGRSAIDLPHTNNESLVTGVITGISWGTYGWMVNMSITSSEAVGGKVDAAQYFIGTTITVDQATIPTDSTGNPVIETGREVTAHLQILFGTYRAYWKGWDFMYVLPPAPTYSGSLWGEVIEPVQIVYGGYVDGITRVHWTVSPAPGTVFVALFNPYGYYIPEHTYIGPDASGFMDMSALYFIDWCSVQLYAHPEAGMTWRKDTWRLDGWQFLDSYSG